MKRQPASYSFAVGARQLRQHRIDGLAGYIARTRTPGGDREVLYKPPTTAVTAAGPAAGGAPTTSVNHTAAPLCTLTARQATRNLGCRRRSNCAAVVAGRRGSQVAAPPIDSMLSSWTRSAADPDPVAVLMPSRSPLVSMRLVFSDRSGGWIPKGKAGLSLRSPAQMLAAGGDEEAQLRPDRVDAMFPMAASLEFTCRRQADDGVLRHRAPRQPGDAYYGLVLRDARPTRLPARQDLDRIKANTIGRRSTPACAALDDEETGKEVLYEEIYAGHPFGHLSLGTSLKDLQTASRLDDVKGVLSIGQLQAAPSSALAGGYPKPASPPDASADLGKDAFGPARSTSPGSPSATTCTGVGSHRGQPPDRWSSVPTRATGIHVGFPIGAVTRGHARTGWRCGWCAPTSGSTARTTPTCISACARSAG